MPKNQPQRRGRPQPGDGVGQVGRRPSPPALLFVIAGMWIVAGILALTLMDASWKLVPGVVFIGIGLLYLRGALTTVARRDGT